MVDVSDTNLLGLAAPYFVLTGNDDTFHQQGLQVQVGYFLIPKKLELAARVPRSLAHCRWLGLDPVVTRGADQAALKRGIEEANVPFCAPMQQYHGLMAGLAVYLMDRAK